MSIEPEQITGNTYIAALAGAILGLKAVQGPSLGERFANLISGFLMAIFLGPAIVDWLHIASPRIASGITFAVGAAGLVGFAAIMEGIRQTQFGAIISGWLSRKGT